MPIVAVLAERLRVETRRDYRGKRYTIFGSTHEVYSAGPDTCWIEDAACFTRDEHAAVAWSAVTRLHHVRVWRWETFGRADTLLKRWGLPCL